MKLFWIERTYDFIIIHITFVRIKLKTKHKENNEVTIPLEYHLSLYNHASFSQAGEDKVVDFIFSFFTKVDRKKIRYLDIGANYPHEGNNTYYYYLKDCTGVLIEPNEKLCEQARQIRPKDKIINAGVKFDDQDEATYYAFEDDTGINTFDEKRAKQMEKLGHSPLPPKKIKMVAINDVIKENFENGVVDYMSLDAESVDILILKSIDFEKYRPKVICVEADKADGNEIVGFMESKNYRLMADTSINYIFLANEEYSVNEKYLTE